jgi:murein endopeptidase
MGTGGSDKDTPYLSDLYSPSASPKIAPSKRLRPVRKKPAHRRQVVRSPDGKRYVLRWTKTTESIGRPNDGRLSGSSRLPRRGAGYVRIGRHAHATDETIAYVEYASWVVSRMFPESPPIAIGDLSGDGGGRLSPHLSHRSGRDVDVGYFRNDNRPMHRFEKMSPNEIDVAKTWIMLEALLSTGAVQYMFVDRAFQKKMFTYALSAGWPEETLLPVFQYPGGRAGTIIRHRGGHNNHFHVRFKCSPDDRACIP